MTYLLLTRDARLVDLTRRAAPSRVLHHAPDAAAALRRVPAVDTAILDGALPAPDQIDFLRWWRAGPGRGRRLLLVEPCRAAVDGAARVRREFTALRHALAGGRLRLDVAAAALHADGHAIPLTPSELAILRTLVDRGRGLSAREIMSEALGYQPPEPAALVRTHVANIRRKCRRHGVDDVIQTRGRRYHAPDLTLGAAAPDPATPT